MDFVTGTHFESSDTDVVVDTSAEVTMMLEATDQEVAMYIDQGADSTTFTVSGMAPLTVFYLYKDSYLDVTRITTDTTGSYTFTLDTSDNHYVWFQPYPSTVVISDPGGGGCFFVGTWDAGSKTCTLTTDVTESVQINSSDVTLDCRDPVTGVPHSIVGSGSGIGVFLPFGNATVKNCEVSGFVRGIRATSSDGHTITGNDIHTVTQRGIDVIRSDLTVITNNHVHDMTGSAIRLRRSSNTNISNNSVDNISAGIGIDVGRSNSVKVVGNQVRNVQPLINRFILPAGEFLFDFLRKFDGQGLRSFSGVELRAS